MRRLLAPAAGALLALAMPLAAQWGTPPRGQTATPALTEEIITATGRVIAFAYGQDDGLTPQQDQILRQCMQNVWAEGDPDDIQGATEMPMLVAQLEQMFAADPSQVEPVRQEIQTSIQEEMIEDPNDPMAPLISALRGQPLSPTDAPPASVTQDITPSLSFDQIAQADPDLPPLTEEIVHEACRMVAFSFGLEELTGAQSQMVRAQLERDWASGDLATIRDNAVIPESVQMIEQALIADPSLTEEVRQDLRQGVIGASQNDPQGPLAQLVQQLGGSTNTGW